MSVRGASLLWCLVCVVFSTPAPASAGGVYFVKAGDTLTRISRFFGVEVESIRRLNRLESADIKPGDRIRIPDKSPKPQPVAAAVLQREVRADKVLPALPVADGAPHHEVNAESSQPQPVAAAGLQREVGADKVLPALPVADGAPHHEVKADRVLEVLCRDETVYHAVVKGDTLTAIATRYATDLDNLLALNGLRKKSRLAIGQRIIVRKSGPHTHTVGRGETLTRIASRYGIAADEIARLNQLDGTTIKAGQQLLVKPCDPYAAAGSAPPSLDGPDAAGLGVVGSGTPSAEMPPLSATTSALSQRVISLARTMLNVPYRFGGSSLRGIDCSAYVQRVYGLMEVQLPRTAREQFAVGARIARGDIQIGDLVFFRTYASFPSHVGIYLGENLFIHASSMVRKVAIDSLDLPYYRKRFIGARRLIADEAPTVASTP